METPYQIKNYDALLDYSTNCVLTISTNPAVILFLKECFSDARQARSVNFPNYTNPKSFFVAPFFLGSVKPRNYPKWTWDQKSRLFVKTKPKLINKDLLGRSRLAQHKNEVISNIILSINLSRLSSRTSTFSQENIYRMKSEQAKAFKDSCYDDNSILKYPYVMQYAEYAGISPQQAADDILFKARLDNQLLEKTELLRLEYFDKVRKANTSKELTAISEQFLLDCYVNAQV